MDKAVLPKDVNCNTVQLTPAKKAVKSRVISVSGTAIDISLDLSVVFLRIKSRGGDCYLKYGTGAVVADDGFDECIGDGETQDFVLSNTTGRDISLISDSSTSVVLIAK